MTTQAAARPIEELIAELDDERRDGTLEEKHGLAAHQIRVAAGQLLQATLMQRATLIADLIVASRRLRADVIAVKLADGRAGPALNWGEVNASLDRLESALEALEL